jgi:hypothetical protein
MLTLTLFALPSALAGCRTPIVDATIVNRGPEIHLLEFDYPYASFGADSLAPGGRYRYEFAIQGSGPLTFQFSDVRGHSHVSKGPQVAKGQQGTLTLTVDDRSQVTWSQQLSGPGQ